MEKISGLLVFLLSIIMFSTLLSAQPDSGSLPPVPNIEDEDLPAIEPSEQQNFDDGNSFNTPSQTSQSSSSTTILIIVIALAVVVLVALIIVVAKHKKQQGSNIQIITGSR